MASLSYFLSESMYESDLLCVASIKALRRVALVGILVIDCNLRRNERER
jgi:hypothetical protein